MTTETMIERVARAIYAAAQAQSGCTGGYKDRLADGLTQFEGGFDLEGLARAALEAMLEPSEGMNEAAKPFRKGVGETAERLFRAMVQAALDGK